MNWINKQKKGPPFSAMRAGQVFMLNDCPYLTLDIVYNGWNAVNLHNNVLYHVDKDQRVTPVDHELIIK